MSKLKEDIETFTIRFGGGNEIDSEDLSIILSNLAKIIKITATEIDPNVYCKLNFKQSRTGSIEIDFATITHISQTLFTYISSSVGVAWMATQTFEKILEIKQTLKGKKYEIIQDNKEKMIVKTNDNKTIEIDKTQSRADLYFKDPVFENCVVNIFSSATKQENRDFTFIDKNNNNTTYSQDDVKYFKDTMISKDTIENRIADKKDIEVELMIKKPDFLGNSKWEVILDKKIDVKIQDEEFLKKVKNGKIKIFAGCKMKTKLSIFTKMDNDMNVIEVEYIVNEIIGNIIEPKDNDNLKF